MTRPMSTAVIDRDDEPSAIDTSTAIDADINTDGEEIPFEEPAEEAELAPPIPREDSS